MRDLAEMGHNTKQNQTKSSMKRSATVFFGQRWTKFFLACLLVGLLITVLLNNGTLTTTHSMITSFNMMIGVERFTLKAPNFKATNRPLINMSEVREGLRRCAKLSIQRNEKCKKVHENSTSYWRPQSKTPNSWWADFMSINLASTCCAYDHEEFLTYDPRDPPFQWELDYLSQPPLRDIRDTVAIGKTEVRLLSNGSTTFQVGDIAVFSIVLYDGWGQKRQLGGDIVRAWLITKKLKASVAAQVEDLGQGEYLATAVLPWSGEVDVKVTVARPRELYRLLFFYQRVFKAIHSFVGVFMANGVTESTPCSTFPAVPGFSSHELCNLTKQNGGYEWYCGKPSKENLHCYHFNSSLKVNVPNIAHFPRTNAEERLLSIDETKRPVMAPTVLKIQVVPSQDNLTTLATPQLPCRDRNLELTIDDDSLSGYLYNGTWRSRACQLTTLSPLEVKQCLTNTEVIIVGDSNARCSYDNIQRLTGTKDKILRLKTKWHQPLWSGEDNYNISLRFYPHKFPFYGSPREKLQFEWLHSAVEKLDAIPAHGRYLVILHEFIHLGTHHLSTLESRLQMLRGAISRVMDRNPHVMIACQSAHSTYLRRRYNKQQMNTFVWRLQKSLLGGLGDRVLFANTWPITVAAVNREHHPTVNPQFTNMFLNYFCGRKL